MTLTMTRVRFAVRQATITERFAYRYGETLAPLTHAYPLYVRRDDGKTSWIDAGFLEERPWAEGREGK